MRLKVGPRHYETADDKDFQSAFDKMMTDSFQGRLSEAMKSTAVDIAIPMHLKGMVSLCFILNSLSTVAPSTCQKGKLMLTNVVIQSNYVFWSMLLTVFF